jgi:hypothetical protein
MICINDSAAESCFGRTCGWHRRSGALSSATISFAAEGQPMTDTLPDRLSTDPKSPHYDAALLERGVGIRFNGAEKTNCEEYCVSEGWVRLAVGKTMDRFGKPMTVKLKGKVEPYLREVEGGEAS